MKNNIIRNRITTPVMVFAAVGALSLTFVSSARAATLSSSDFSLGYGATVLGPQSTHWNTTETSGSNTNVTGPFALSVAFTARTPSPDGDNSYDNGASSSGPTFTGRSLGNSAPNSGFSSWSPRFQVTLNGSYTGGTPGDAAPIPNYQFSLVISSIRIWGTARDFNADGLADMYFTETRPLNTPIASSSPQTLPSSGPSVEQAAAYAQLVWDPADFNTPGLSDARNFVLDTALFPHQRGIDGFEVFGNLVVTYDAIPEPATMAFLGMSALVLIRRLRR